MQTALKKEIKRLASKILAKEAAKAKKIDEYRLKFLRRTGNAARLPRRRRATRPLHRHFDPIYCKRNANFLAKTIWHKILNLDYEPTPAINYLIPKPAGGTRSIMAFSIPDAAVANVFLRKTRERNLKRLSSSSYAYHPQKNVFDAILALHSFIDEQKLFAVQIDFEKYFDSIPSTYLKKCINDKEMIGLTPHEKYVFEEFLYHQYAQVPAYALGSFDRRIKGTPQGSSVSLLLANLANHSLDTALEKCPGKFVRFADDVTALCNNYHDAEKIENCFTQHCKTSGLVINEDKSPGVGIISLKGELRSYKHFDYLGYRFTKDGLTMPDKVEKRIKDKISKLVHIYLIHYPEKFGFDRVRQGRRPNYDWDLLGLITELRKYLYGGLTEANISAFLNDGQRLPKMRGLMGFYALLEQSDSLKRIDGWMVNSIKRAMKKRANILRTRYSVRNPLTPSEETLISGTWLDIRAWRRADNDTENTPERGLPSLVRGWRAARKYYYTYGLENVEPPSYFSYY